MSIFSYGFEESSYPAWTFFTLFFWNPESYQVTVSFIIYYNRQNANFNLRVLSRVASSRDNVRSLLLRRRSNVFMDEYLRLKRFNRRRNIDWISTVAFAERAEPPWSSLRYRIAASRIAAAATLYREVGECMPAVRQSCRRRKVESRTCLQIVHVNRTWNAGEHTRLARLARGKSIVLNEVLVNGPAINDSSIPRKHSPSQFERGAFDSKGTEVWKFQH